MSLKRRSKSLEWWCASPALIGVVALALAGREADFTSRATEKNVEGVQFDAVIAQQSPTTGKGGTYFVRYWVSTNFIRVFVDWAEPHSRRGPFHAASPGLEIESTPETFRIRHDERPAGEQHFQKPVGQRGIFRHMYGDYPISNIRFSESEATSMRLDALKLAGMLKPENGTQRVFRVSFPRTEKGVEGGVASCVAEGHNGRIDSIRLLDTEEELLKSIAYSYGSRDGASNLSCVQVYLPQRPIEVGFRGVGMKVQTATVSNRVRDFFEPYHKGGRKCVVDYRSIDFGDTAANLPVLVEVRRANDGKFMRSAKLSNFRRFNYSESQRSAELAQTSAVPNPYGECAAFLAKYWKCTPDQVSQGDRAAIHTLLDRVAVPPGQMQLYIGDRLRRLNARIYLSRLLRDQELLEATFDDYLITLSTNGFHELVLWGGYRVINTSVIWNRTTEASHLLDILLGYAAGIKDLELAKQFASEALENEDVWVAAKLAEGVLTRPMMSAESRFEFEALRCLALQRSRWLFSSATNTLARAQLKWIAASTTTNRLDEMVIGSKLNARSQFTKIPQPAEFQRALMNRLER